MSGSNRGGFNSTLAGFICLAALLVGLVAAFHLGSLKGEQAERHGNSPRQYSESAKSYASRACRGVDPAAMFECVQDAQERSAEAAHTEQDLIAQQDSAFAAKVMLGVSAVGTVFGLLGLFFIYQTLAETRETNVIARDTAQRQLRAYLVVTKTSVTGMMPGERMCVTYFIKNVGQTPAYEMRSRSQVSYPAGNIAATEAAKTSIDPKWLKRSPYPKGTMIGAGEFVRVRVRLLPFSADEIARLRRGDFTMIIAGFASYRDIFGRRRLLTFNRCLAPANLKPNGRGRFSARMRGNKGN